MPKGKKFGRSKSLLGTMLSQIGYALGTLTKFCHMMINSLLTIGQLWELNCFSKLYMS